MISEPGGICLKNVPFKQNPDTVFFQENITLTFISRTGTFPMKIQ